jgi:predicted nuclease of predicted toxin-antitoxin system
LKLLVDENLAPSLAKKVADLFPGSIHVRDAGLSATEDTCVWEYAKLNGFAFLTKDRDFASMSLTWGGPPKVVLLETGNCSTAEVERIVRANAIRFSELERHPECALLILR